VSRISSIFLLYVQYFVDSYQGTYPIAATIDSLVTALFIWFHSFHLNSSLAPIRIKLSQGESNRALSTGADLRQKASSATLPKRPPLPSLLLPPLPNPLLPSPSSHPLPFSIPSPPLDVGTSNPAMGSGGAL